MFRSQWEDYLNQPGDQPQAPEGVSYLPELGVFQFSGPDTLNFLQGYFTCDTATLAEDALTATALCNIKGRVVVNGWCYRADHNGQASVIVIIHQSLISGLAEFFKAYAMFSKTILTDLSDTTLIFAGPAGCGMEGLGLTPDRALTVLDNWEQARTLWDLHPHRDAQSWQLGLIEAGFPLVSAATSEAFLPQMLNLDQLGAVNFDKGCYLGQEIVARAQHRGEVKRRLRHMHWQGPTAPSAGAELSADVDSKRTLGTVINAVATRADAGVCLAIVAAESTDSYVWEGTVFTASS
jgi:folate-binding protein YgfZ